MLLLLRNMTPRIPAPTTGWDKFPLQSDISEGADLVRLRTFRNEYAHSHQSNMSSADFGRKWTLLTEVRVMSEYLVQHKILTQSVYNIRHIRN